jgi:DNA-binding CsgD family transcriptional regulator
MPKISSALQEIELRVKSGQSATEISRALFMDISTIYRYRKRLVSQGRLDADILRDAVYSKKQEQIELLLKKGWMVAEIADHLSLSSSTIWEHRRRLKADGRLNWPLSERIELLLEEGMTTKEISVQLSIGLSTVTRYKARWRWGATEKSYSFRSPDGTIHAAKTMTDLAHEFGLSEKKLSDVKQGRRAHHKGWTLVQQNDG